MAYSGVLRRNIENKDHPNEKCNGRQLFHQLPTGRANISFQFLLPLMILFFIASCFSSAKAEGTKEIMQLQNHPGRVLLDPEFGGFAMTGSGPSDRLHIRINEVGETIYFGMGKSILSDGTIQETANDVEYRILDPNGNVVIDFRLQSTAGPGYINSYQEAVSGPNVFNPSGYDPQVLSCNTTGDYYIEFDFPESEYGGRREFEFFDITVATTDNKPVQGRVWSKAWMFTVTELGGDPWANPFYGKLYILTDDGIVSSVDFNGMKPFVFTLSSNGTGVQNTGNSILDRKSVESKSTYPQYKVFLNDPDSVCFPSGSFGDFAAPTSISGESPPYCINVNTTKPGAIQVLIDFNGQPGYQVGTTDVLLAQNVDEGESCINWDGRDGKGKLTTICSDPVMFYVTYISGLTHMPIFDVENNENGFIIELVRPATASSHLALYWDDSNIPGYSFPPSGGCDGTQGCHRFDNFFGDDRTINTWWYSTSKIVDSLEFFKPSVSLDQVNIENQSCVYKHNGSIEIIGSGGEPPFLYSISSNNFQNNNFFENLTAGEYSVVIKDKNNCTQTTMVNVELNTFIEASFETSTIGPYNTIQFEFTGAGASNFSWDFGDGEVSSLQNPDHVFNYDTTYFVKLISESGAPDFCVDSTSSYLDIYAPLLLFAPTAFSPNGDNLNDEFQLVGSGFQFYEIYIFNRNGQQLFYTNNIDDSWDGTWNSELCEEGAYAYIATVKGKSGRSLQKKGTVILLR